MNQEEALGILNISRDLSNKQIVDQVKQQLKKLHNDNTDTPSEKIEACKFLTDGQPDQAEIFSNLVIAAIDNNKLGFLGLLLETVKNNDEFNYLNTESTGGNIPLNFALRYTIHYNQMVEAIELLLKHGVDPNTKDREGKSSLHCVINNSQNGTFCHKVTELLLNKGTDPNAKDSQGKTLLHHLFKDSIHDRVEVMTLLLTKGADPNIKNERGESLLYQAYSEKRDDTIRLFLGCNTNLKKSEHVQSLLYKACSEGRYDTVKLLLESGVDPNTKNENGESLLHIACSKGRDNIVKLLLEKGANPNIQNESGESLLYKAYSERRDDIVTLLLKHGANPNIQNESGESLLYEACSEGRDNIVKLLLERGIDPNTKDQKGKTPLSFVFKDKFLHEREVRVVSLLLKHGADPNTKDQKGRSLFYYIIDSYSDNRYKTVELLLDKGADPNMQDDRGRASLHYLCGKHYKEDSSEIAKLLLRRGADPDLKDKDGKKPINLVSPYSDVGKLFGAIDYNKAAVLGVVTLLATAGSIALISGVADAYIGEVWCFVLAVVIIVIALCCAHCAKTQLPPSGPSSVLHEASAKSSNRGPSLVGGA